MSRVAARQKTRQAPQPGLRYGVLVMLGALVMVSALAVVYAKYQSRVLFAELQNFKQAKDSMDVEWGQLQLEQSTWAAHGRIESMARKRLGMVLPSSAQVVIVRP